MFIHIWPFLSLCSFPNLFIASVGIRNNLIKYRIAHLNLPDGTSSVNFILVSSHTRNRKYTENMCNSDNIPCKEYPEIHSDEKTVLTAVDLSAGCGETKHRVGGSGSERWKDAGFQPWRAGEGGRRGQTYHRGSGRQNLRPERPETEPGKAHRQIATAAVVLHLHSQHWFHPCVLDLCFTGVSAEQQSKHCGGKHGGVCLFFFVF